MGRRYGCSKGSLAFGSSALVFYIAMKIVILMVIDSKWLSQFVATTPNTAAMLAAYYSQLSVNGSIHSYVNNSACQLGIPESVASARCSSSYCDLITCDKLVVGDFIAVLGAAQFMGTHARNAVTNEKVLELALNCSSLYSRGRYERKPLRPSDVEFPIAFNILLHTNAEQFERLLQAIYRPQNVYCVHVDAKASWTFHAAVAAVANCFDNVFLGSRSQHVVYAGFTRLQADIDCMNDHLAHPAAIKWRYLINIPGQSYPLKTPEEMVDILRIYNGSNDIEGLPAKRRIYARYKKVWRESYDSGKMISSAVTHVPPPHDIDIIRGSGYGIFSRAFVQFVTKDKRAKDLLEWSRATYSPDEHYWSTLHHLYSNPHLHTPGGFRGLPESKPFLAVYVKWYPLAKCAGHWKRGVCILGVGDLPDLVARKEFFVNKFELDSQPLAFECMESWLRQRVRCPSPLDLEFYRSLPFVKHK